MSNGKRQPGGGREFGGNGSDRGEGNAHDLESEKGARARGRMRSTERGWLEDQIPEKRHSGLMKGDFVAAIDLLLESSRPREFTDTFNSACHMADAGETWARSQMRFLLSSQGPFMVYEEGGVQVIDYRTTDGTG